MKESQGDDILNGFLKHYKESSPIFTISDALPVKDGEIYYPVPQLPYKQKNNVPKSEMLMEYLKYKILEGVKYINSSTFNNMLSENFENITGLNENYFQTMLRSSLPINRKSLSAAEGFSFDTFAVKYIKKDYKLAILIKILNKKAYNDFGCEKILQKVFEFGFGKKKSSGYGAFKVESFNPFTGIKEPGDDITNAFVTLSNYLPSNSDGIRSGYYKYHVKYGKLGEELAFSRNPYKYPLILFKPGSCFVTGVRKDFYGRCTREGEISPLKYVIQNGIAFTLRMKIGVS
jgi:CRISPR/Cas system CSM-associated protein Csm4 (group 5 of RAMP superfamily)